MTAEREAALARISGDVSAAVAIADAQRQQYVRYRDQILPQALEVERMAEDSYRLGQTNIAAYLQALQSTRDVRLRALQSAADLQTALADLDRAIGAAPPAATRPPHHDSTQRPWREPVGLAARPTGLLVLALLLAAAAARSLRRKRSRAKRPCR